MQAMLFPRNVEERVTIPGLRYLPNYIDEVEAAQLLETIDQQPWLNDLKRRVQHYGYKYDYKARGLTADSYLGSLPGWLETQAAALCVKGIFAKKPDQVIINEYLPGQGISPHADVNFFDDTIASLSLASTCMMDFTKDNQKASLLLEPLSLLVLSGDARYGWKHSIPARKSDIWQDYTMPRSRRVSLTFRTVK